MTAEAIERIVRKSNRCHGELISILQHVQAECGYLPEDALRVVAERTGRDLVDVFGVATFYKSFSLKPKGKHVISVCTGTACHVRGAPTIQGEFERQFGIKAGETTCDRQFTLETVNCLGACALGPIVVVDGCYFSNVSTAKVKEILKRVRGEGDAADEGASRQAFPIEVSCPRCNHVLTDPTHLMDGYPSIRLKARFRGKCGWFRLSSLYGSNRVESQHEIPKDSLVRFFCPHCDAELVGTANCSECDALMVTMAVRGGGVLHLCSRRGCKGHMLELNPPVLAAVR